MSHEWDEGQKSRENKQETDYVHTNACHIYIAHLDFSVIDSIDHVFSNVEVSLVKHEQSQHLPLESVLANEQAEYQVL